MLLKLSKFFTYISLFSVLVVVKSTFFPFIGGKAYFFRVAIELAVAFAFLWWAFEASHGEAMRRVRTTFRKPLVIAVSFFALAFLLASVFAYDPHAAFWSNYERGEGGFQMLHYYAFFLLLAMFFDTRKDWNRFFVTAVIVTICMVGYGIGAAALTPHCPIGTHLTDAGPSSSIPQICTGSSLTASSGAQYAPVNRSVFGFVGPYLRIDGQPVAPTFLGRIFSDRRFQGSLGNPAYVAPYLMFGIFYCLYLGFKEGIRKQKRVLWVVIAAVFFIFLILTQTRGTFLGLIAAALVFLLYLAIRGSGRIRRFSIITLLAFFLVNATLFIAHDNTLVRKIPFVERFYNLGSAESFAPRLWTWGSAWEGFKERPVFGWGPENFPAVFDAHFDSRHFIPGQDTETWFDRAHSVVFDYLSETGVVGFFAYLSIFAFFFAGFFVRDRVRMLPDVLMRRALILALPVGYLVQALVLFDVLPIYLNLFIFLAFAAWWFDASHDKVSGEGGESTR
ncbi:MAG: O-antigen ligase family protein [Patescibacteria group bacterium]|nr:O-antigen ligase family protein [Patescibacteria group bacterium]